MRAIPTLCCRELPPLPGSDMFGRTQHHQWLTTITKVTHDQAHCSSKLRAIAFPSMLHIAYRRYCTHASALSTSLFPTVRVEFLTLQRPLSSSAVCMHIQGRASIQFQRIPDSDSFCVPHAFITTQWTTPRRLYQSIRHDWGRAKRSPWEEDSSQVQVRLSQPCACPSRNWRVRRRERPVHSRNMGRHF